MEKSKCVECGNEFPASELRRIQERDVCRGCVEQHWRVCDCCEEHTRVEDIVIHDEQVWCPDCRADNLCRCATCNSWVYQSEACDDGGDYYCEECYHPEDCDENSFEIASYDLPFKKTPSETFRDNKFRQFCGVEIEAVNDNLCNNELSLLECQTYHFNQHPDGSLGSDGAEFSSTPANGDLLFDRIRVFCQFLESRDFYINSDCGLHIHVEVSRRLAYLKKVYAFYKKFEKLFFQMLPQSRQNNQYCRKFDNIYQDLKMGEVLKMEKCLDFAEKLYAVKGRKKVGDCRKHHSHGKRYGWVNFHSLFYRGTLEIRAHSGTLNPQKIINWLKIHLACLNLVKNLPLDIIRRLPDTKACFLSFFDKKLQYYIKQRWKKFKPSTSLISETDLTTRQGTSPIPEPALEVSH